MVIKKNVSLIWSEFIYGGHILSLGAGVGILLSAFFLLDKDINILTLLVGYFSLQVVYNYDHLTEEKDSNPERTNYLRNSNRNLFLIAYILGLILTSILINIQTFLFAIFLTLGGLLYTVKLKEVSKNIFLFKNIYISSFFALLPFLVWFSNSPKNKLPLLLIALFIFLRLLLNTIYFDIKDIESDKINELKTFPVVFGKRKTIKTLYFFNFLTFTPLVIGTCLGILPISTLSLLLLFFYTHYYLKRSLEETNENMRKLSYIMADGEYILWPCLLFISNFIF